MHDLDRTQMEFEPEEGLSGEFEPEVPEGEDFEFDAGEIGDQEGRFSEGEEMELASQLLEISDEAELDQFLGSLIKKAGRAAGGFLKSPLGRALGGWLKGVARKALPVAGGALGTFFGGPVGGMVGGKLASSAGSMFGLELEGLSQEDQEFEVARRYVRLAGSAAQKAAVAPTTTAPSAAAKAAVIEAAKQHAPGLLSRIQQPYGTPGSGGSRIRRSGRWLRRGNKIILHGVYV